ncbi:autotransporter family protein [Achromobacter aloeverae]|uniref:Autotransporter outer membrane beta-barrel domain-containing protein n=1 Tax=Achromobacter aloeverae TaxID=1750518 RepID=A0A4Q1HQ17_9BURK|nr:autotransporter outer membrane beta-barrel domain-containing protein [Achromobacter aloeverae]RXN93148.1 autotransporter outer membrane beta-barrel domain-containing protein [Achromobacter aloeverae]
MPVFPRSVFSQWLSGIAAVPILTFGVVLYPGQAAIAGDCTGGAIVVCSGPASGSDVGQFIYNLPDPVSVTTQPGFGLSVATGEDAIDIYGAGGVSFVDGNQSTITTNGIFGIYAYNDGSGDLNITSTGSVTSTAPTGDGIRGDNYGANMTISAHDTQGQFNGITANSYGSGSVHVVSTGTAVGLDDAGIYAYMVSGTDLTIDAVNTRGDLYGIVATGGTGALTVTSTGRASATNGYGIWLYNRGTDITLTAADTHGGAGDGIHLDLRGTGAALVTSTGTATGSLNGIAASVSSGTDVTINAVDATGVSGAGIKVSNYAATGAVVVNATGTVTGGTSGIAVSNASGTGTTINALGHVLGGTGAGIATESTAGVLSVVDVGATAVVESASGTAITNDGGDSHVVIHPGGVVNGAINLGAGSDTVDLLAGLSGITVLDGGGGGVDTLNLSNAAGATHAGADIRNWSVVNLDNSALTLTDTSLTVGTTSDPTTGVFLRNGSTLALQQSGFALNGNLALDAGTTLLASTRGVGTTTITGSVTNAGAIALSGGGVGSVLTIGGNYVGKGGVIALNTVLGNDASATDRVTIKGDTSGTSTLRVANAGGTGALTTEGIELVSVAGASNGVFSLAGDYQINGKPAVVAGAYAYQLYKGNASGTEANNWYLRSELQDDPPTATVPDTPTGPVSATPLYQPGAPVYEAYPQALLALNGVSTLQQRVGNRFWSGAGNGQAATESTGASGSDKGGAYTDGTGAWGRIEGRNNRLESHASTTGADLKQNVSKVQVGTDVLLAKRETGSLVGGGYFQYLHGSTVTRSVYGNGDISTDGYGLGGTLTWYADNGYYVDGQAQVMRYNSDLNSRLASRRLVKGNDATGYTLSVESGKRLALTPEWSLTPQAQLAYSRVDFDRFDDAFGATVRSDRGASLQGRLGVTLDRETRGGKDGTNRSHVYGIANLYYEFLNGSQVDVAGVNVKSRPDRLWGGVGAGVSHNWGKDKYSVYAEGLVNTSLERVGSSRTLQGNVGFRMRW